MAQLLAIDVVVPVSSTTTTFLMRLAAMVTVNSLTYVLTLIKKRRSVGTTPQVYLLQSLWLKL
jgi:hypothetical protein